MNIVDVLILGLILLGALQGYRRGLLSGLANFMGSLAGFVLAAHNYEAVLKALEKRFPLQVWVEPFVYKVIWAQIQTQAQVLNGSILEQILSLFPLELRSLVTNGKGALQSVTQGVLEEAAHRMAVSLAENLLRLFAFALVFYGVYLLVHLAVGIFLRPLGAFSGTLNHGGGLMFGGLSVFVALAVLTGILSPVLALGISPKLVLIQESWFYPQFLQLFKLLDQVFAAQVVPKLLDPLQLKNIFPAK